MSRGGTTVELVGARKLRTALRRADVDMSTLRAPNLAAARIVAGVGAARAPRRTGTLAANVRPGATRSAGVVRAGGARVPYAAPIHWGWPSRHIQPNPFLADAAAATEPMWIRAYMAEMERIVSRVGAA